LGLLLLLLYCIFLFVVSNSVVSTNTVDAWKDSEPYSLNLSLKWPSMCREGRWILLSYSLYWSGSSFWSVRGSTRWFESLIGNARTPTGVDQAWCAQSWYGLMVAF